LFFYSATSTLKLWTADVDAQLCIDPRPSHSTHEDKSATSCRSGDAPGCAFYEADFTDVEAAAAAAAAAEPAIVVMS